MLYLIYNWFINCSSYFCSLNVLNYIPSGYLLYHRDPNFTIIKSLQEMNQEGTLFYLKQSCDPTWVALGLFCSGTETLPQLGTQGNLEIVSKIFSYSYINRDCLQYLDGRATLYAKITFAKPTLFYETKFIAGDFFDFRDAINMFDSQQDFSKLPYVMFGGCRYVHFMGGCYIFLGEAGILWISPWVASYTGPMSMFS